MPNLAICLTLVRFALFGSRGSPTITLSSCDFNTKLKFGGINRLFFFSYISFTLFTIPSASCWIFLLFLHWLPCQLYRCINEQQYLQRYHHSKSYRCQKFFGKVLHIYDEGSVLYILGDSSIFLEANWSGYLITT